MTPKPEERPRIKPPAVPARRSLDEGGRRPEPPAVPARRPVRRNLNEGGSFDGEGKHSEPLAARHHKSPATHKKPAAGQLRPRSEASEARPNTGGRPAVGTARSYRSKFGEAHGKTSAPHTEDTAGLARRRLGEETEENGTPLRFVPLGGLEEIGRNCMFYEYKNEIVILDMGLQFPEEETPGMDYIIPNISYLEKKRANIQALILTHAPLRPHRRHSARDTETRQSADLCNVHHQGNRGKAAGRLSQ